LLTLDSVNTLALEATANALIVNALMHGTPGLPAPLSGEVRAAHATVLAGASQVAAAWGPILAPLRFQVKSRAVLIHSAPMVEFTDAITGKQERRELGDVLIVVDMLDGANVVDRRAALTQAKLATKTGHVSLDRSGKAQRNLYLRWPAFTLPQGYRSHPRDLNDASCRGPAEDGSRFGGIDLHGTQRDWFQIPTAETMNARGHPSLGTSLMRMACGNAGRPATDGGKDPWSQLVNELMTVTLGVAYPAGRGPLRSWETLSLIVSPSSTKAHNFHSVALFDVRGAPPGSVVGEADESEPLGISVIHIELEKIPD
jgi:hypothetical protein